MKLNNQELSRRYAKALFEVACENKQQKNILQELSEISQVYQQVAGLSAIVVDRRLNTAAKQEIVDLLKRDASETLQNFLQLLFDYRRLEILPLVITDYIKFYNQSQKIKQATVISAVDLTPEQLNALKESLKQRLDASEIHLNTKLDPSIIGGVIVHAGDLIIDGSVKTRMQKLSRFLIPD